MTDPEAEQTSEPRKTLRDKVREHLLAAEVAAEESAGYGAVTTGVEAAEAAVDPEHELGSPDEEKPAPD